METQKIEGGTASLEDDNVWCDEERRLAEVSRILYPISPEKVGVNLVALDYTQDLALDNVEHLLPHCAGHIAESLERLSAWTVACAQRSTTVDSAIAVTVGGFVGELLRGRCKPNLEKFLRPFERTGGRVWLAENERRRWVRQWFGVGHRCVESASQS